MTNDTPTIIKKYANRRLYHTGTSTYVTLEDLARMVKDGEDFVVQDAKSGEDITRAVLGQIIFEHETRGQHLLPLAFLRQLIRFYDDSMKAVLPTYLETSLAAFTRDRDKLREQMARAFQGDPFGPMEEQARRNMDLFAEALRLWMPFSGAPMPPPAAKKSERNDEIEALRRQLQELQKTIDGLARKS